MKSYIMTDVGLKRSSNQDAFCKGVTSSGIEFAVLCDGMGGHRGGNVAAEVAVRSFYELLSHRLKAPVRTKDVKSILSGTVARVSLLIADIAAKNPDFAGMGSTVVLTVRFGKKMAVAHVGDSRAYLYRNGKLIRLTKDHSLVQEMIDRGEITPEEGETHPHRNVITRSLGYTEDSAPEILFTDVKPGDLFLLCTDGLTVTVNDNDLQALLSALPQTDPASQLVSEALARGGPDNVTVGILLEDKEDLR